MRIDPRAILTRSTFWFVMLAGLVVQVVPYILTLGAPAADGNTVAGFPFTFLSFGGWCGFTDGPVTSGQCPRSFIPLHIFFDTAVIVGVAALVAWYRGRRESLSTL